MNRVNQAEHSEPVLHQGAGLYTDFYELTMAQGYFYPAGQKSRRASTISSGRSPSREDM